MPLDFAAAICESETAAAGVLVEVFFVEPPPAAALGAEVAGVAGALAAGAELAALVLLPEDLLELLAVVFELSAAAAPASAVLDFSALFFRLLLASVVLVLVGSLEVPAASAVLDFSVLFFRLLLAPVVLVLVGSLAVSAEAAPPLSDFLLFLLLLLVELLPVVSELAELSEVAESDFFDFVLPLDELESLLELVLLVVSSEVDFFFVFLLLVDVVSCSVDVPDWASWDWARATVADKIYNRQSPAAHAVNILEKRVINMDPTFRSARLKSERNGVAVGTEIQRHRRSERLAVRRAASNHPAPLPPLSTVSNSDAPAVAGAVPEFIPRAGTA
jgi:hypothetical protein